MTGTLYWNDIGPGAWSLVLPNGDSVDLDVGALDPKTLRALDGKRVTITVANEQRFGWSMGGAFAVVVQTMVAA